MRGIILLVFPCQMEGVGIDFIHKEIGDRE